MRAAAVRYGPVFALTLLGAVLRFPTLDRQSFWLDELVTASLLDRSLGDVLGEIPRTEATPYLYYVVAWLWSSVFGLGEVGLRSLSALAGTATIPVAYGAGVVLVSRRAGIVAAALVATSPFLVWYSQEARSYALFALLGATSVLTFGLALRGDRRWLAGWCVVCALTLATHYFGVFLVGAEAVWLLARLRPRLPVVLASLVPVATLLAHLPVLLDQRGNGEAVAGSSLASRIAGIPKNLVVGYSFPLEAAGSVLAACLVLLGLVLAARLTPRERRGALVAGSLAAAVVLVPIVLAAVGAGLRHRAERDRRRRPGRGLRRSGARVEAAGSCGRRAAVRALRRDRARPGGRRDATVAPTGAALPRPSGPTHVRRAVVVTPSMSRSLWRPVPARAGRAPRHERRRPGDRRDRPGDGGRVLGGPPRAAGRGHAEAGPGLPGRRRSSDARRSPSSATSPSGRPPSRSTTLAGLALTDEQPGILLQGPERARLPGSDAGAGGSIPEWWVAPGRRSRSVARPSVPWTSPTRRRASRRHRTSTPRAASR